MMLRDNDLRECLHRIDHKGYPAYKDTRGQYQFAGYLLSIDHVREIRLLHHQKLV